VVIVGGGFGGLTCARKLRGVDADVLVIDKRNHHLFQPLLYQVATAALSPNDVAEPIRSVLRRQKNARVLLDEVIGFDFDERAVRTKEGRAIGYDRLVLAFGATTNYFGKRDEWSDQAPGLKSLDDAIEIRERFLRQFERAEAAESEADRRRLLRFVVVGGGPTGVELAGTISEVARNAIPKDFANVTPQHVSVTLVQGSEHVLEAYPVSLRKRAESDLRALGVEVVTGELADAIDEKGVTLKSGRRVEAGAMFWGAGVKPSPLAEAIDAERDERGRVRVADDLSLPERPEVFVLGDLTRVEKANGAGTVPGVAAAAIQMGSFAAKAIRRDLHNGRGVTSAPSRASLDRPAFRYFDKGMLATIGRGKAVGVVRGAELRGALAWFAWLFVHIVYLVGFRNRLIVTLQWAYAYVFYIRGASLIVGRRRDERR